MYTSFNLVYHTFYMFNPFCYPKHPNSRRRRRRRRHFASASLAVVCTPFYIIL